MIEIFRTGSAPGVSIPTIAWPPSWYAVRRRSSGLIITLRSAPSTIRSSASVKSASVHLSWLAARREQRRLVDEVREVGADHAGRRRGDPAEVDVGGERHAARVHPQDRLAARRGRAAARRRGGRSGRAAAAPGRARPAGSSRRSRSRSVDESKPSISVRIWFSVCSRSSLPPLKPATPEVRERPIASSSSMKMIAGAASFACVNRSRTRDAPTPTIASTNSEADIEKNGTSASPATARASSVLPVPGGPESSTPCGMRAPSRGTSRDGAGSRRPPVSSSFASSIPATSANVTRSPAGS